MTEVGFKLDFYNCESTFVDDAAIVLTGLVSGAALDARSSVEAGRLGVEIVARVGCFRC